MTVCYLGLGSNLASPERQLRRAIRALRKLPKSFIIKVAAFHHSIADGRKAQPNYVNTVIALHTQLSPNALLLYCQKIEQQQGRVRKVRWGARTLDIDILLFGKKTINTPTLCIPHPRMLERDFVLLPLLEIASAEVVIKLL